MRFAQVGLGIRRRAIWKKPNSCRFLVRSASYFPHQKRQTTTATCEPPERSSESVSQKNPSAITNRERMVSKNSCKHRLPQARCLLRPTLLPSARLKQRAGLKVLRQFTTRNSNRTTICQLVLITLLSIFYAS